jgi:hypothetical protein
MLSTGSDTFLRVDGSVELAQGGRRVGRAEEDGLVLIHSSIDEEQGGYMHTYIKKMQVSRG